MTNEEIFRDVIKDLKEIIKYQKEVILEYRESLFCSCKFPDRGVTVDQRCTYCGKKIKGL
jgi:hypothetical protein